MRLYMDDVLKTEDAGQAEVDAAFWAARRSGGTLELRDGVRRLSARPQGEGWFLEVQQREDLRFGFQAGEEEAVSALAEFVAGFTPRLPWKKMLPARPPKRGRPASVVFGDAYHPDCPLCRMGL